MENLPILVLPGANYYFKKHFSTNINGILEILLRYSLIRDCDSNEPPKTLFSLREYINDLSVYFRDIYCDTEFYIYESYYKDCKDEETLKEKGFILLDNAPYPISTYLTKKLKGNVFVYQNINENRCIILLDEVATKNKNTYLEIATILPRLIPWHFKSELTEEEISMFKNLSKYLKGNDEIIFPILDKLCIEKGYTKEFFYNYSANNILDNYENVIANQMITLTKSAIEDTLGLIKNYEEKIRRQYENYIGLNDKYQKYIQFGETHSKEFLNFFTSQKTLHLDIEKSRNGIIYYYVTTLIQDWDKDVFIKNFNNTKSYFHKNNYFSIEKVQKILWAVFSEEIASIRAIGAFSLNCMSSLSPVRDFFNTYNQTKALNHPHIYHYGCLGGERTIDIEKSLVSGDYQSAIFQTIGSISNINFGDATVMEKFFKDIYMTISSNYTTESTKYIILNDGTEMTANEFLEYLEARENKEVKQDG